MANDIERANFVRKQREGRAWTQSQLADVANVSLRTIQRLEKDGTASFETQMAVAQAFGIDVKQLCQTSIPEEKISPEKRVHLLPRLTSGKDLAGVVVGTDRFQFEHDDDQDPRSVNAMKDILGLLKQDVVRLYDADSMQRSNVEDELSQEIEGLLGCGYFFFGIKRIVPRISDGKATLTSVATLYMSHARSPKIVKDRAFMVIPAILPEVVHGGEDV